MNSKTSPLRTFACAALLTISANAHAAFTIFTTEASFLAAVTAPGVDTFAGLSTTAATNSPIARNAGPYPYNASSTTSFFGAGTPANPALSTNVDSDVITFFNLGAASAIGGFFFGSTIESTLVPATIVLTATDSLGATSTQTFLGSPTNFFGFVSDGTITSLVVNTAMPGAFIFPTVDNLTIALAAVTPVPEPQTWSLFFAGLAALTFCARRKRRPQA